MIVIVLAASVFPLAMGCSSSRSIRSGKWQFQEEEEVSPDPPECSLRGCNSPRFQPGEYCERHTCSWSECWKLCVARPASHALSSFCGKCLKRDHNYRYRGAADIIQSAQNLNLECLNQAWKDLQNIHGEVDLRRDGEENDFATLEAFYNKTRKELRFHPLATCCKWGCIGHKHILVSSPHCKTHTLAKVEDANARLRADRLADWQARWNESFGKVYYVRGGVLPGQREYPAAGKEVPKAKYPRLERVVLTSQGITNRNLSGCPAQWVGTVERVCFCENKWAYYYQAKWDSRKETSTVWEVDLQRVDAATNIQWAWRDYTGRQKGEAARKVPPRTPPSSARATRTRVGAGAFAPAPAPVPTPGRGSDS